MGDRSRYGRIAVCAAAALYAAFSSPSPDTPGLIELLIILLLLIGAAFGGFTLKEKWAVPLTGLIVYGATIPLLIGVLAPAGAGDILRDVIAFGALALPLLLAGLFREHGRMLLCILIGIGLGFSARYLLMPDLVMATLASSTFDDRLLYLANSPLVFFAASWLLLQGSFGERGVIRAGLHILLAILPIVAMAGMMQRATLALLALTWLGGLAVTWIHDPRRGAILSVMAATVLAVMWPVISGLTQDLIVKTETVGWNARFEEWATIYAQISVDPVALLFGRGWGALMQSPAVGNEWVRFSHSLVSSMLWKAGWVGLILTVAALGALMVAALRRLRMDMITASALILALLPACFLYGSYKSLCFGLLLTAFGCLQLDKPHPGVLTTPGQNV